MHPSRRFRAIPPRGGTAALLRRLGAPALAAVLLALSGCISTALIEQWKDPAYAGAPLHKVLVVAVERDAGERRLWETAMVQALGRQHIAATASYQLYPDRAPTANELAATARQQGFDGVLATHFVSAGRRVSVVPGWYGPRWGWGWGYWGYGGWWNAAYGPGYVQTDYRADFETEVFTVAPNGGMLIWTGITRSINLESVEATTDQISRVLVPVLIRQGILAAP